MSHSTVEKIESEILQLIDEYSELETWCDDVGNSRESSLCSVIIDDLNELLGYIERAEMEKNNE